eukprot:gene15221-18012_t
MDTPTLRNILTVTVEPDSSVSKDSFTEALKTLARNNPLNLVSIQVPFTLGAADDMDLDRLCGDLNKLAQCTPSNVRVLCFETVTEKSNAVGYGVSNTCRVLMTAEPICSDLVKRIEAGEMSRNVDTPKRLETLTEEMQWDRTSINSIWTFGPENNNSNVLVYAPTSSPASALSNAAKEQLIKMFRKACCKGFLCQDMLVGVRFTITDLEYNATEDNNKTLVDSAIQETLAESNPRLVEPILLYRFKVPESDVALVHSLAQGYSGTVVKQTTENKACTIDCQFPAAKTIGLPIRESIASGRMSVEVSLSHWQVNESDPYDQRSTAGELIKNIRELKGLQSIHRF